jgi:hypothetical protein
MAVVVSWTHGGWNAKFISREYAWARQRYLVHCV